MQQVNNSNPNITLLETYDTNHWVGGGQQIRFRMGNTEYLYTSTNSSPGGGTWQTTIYRLKENRIFEGPAIFSVRENVDFNTAVNRALGLNG